MSYDRKHILHGFQFTPYVLRVFQFTANEFKWHMFFFTCNSIKLPSF